MSENISLSTKGYRSTSTSSILSRFCFSEHAAAAAALIGVTELSAEFARKFCVVVDPFVTGFPPTSFEHVVEWAGVAAVNIVP